MADQSDAAQVPSAANKSDAVPKAASGPNQSGGFRKVSSKKRVLDIPDWELGQPMFQVDDWASYQRPPPPPP